MPDDPFERAFGIVFSVAMSLTIVVFMVVMLVGAWRFVMTPIC